MLKSTCDCVRLRAAGGNNEQASSTVGQRQSYHGQEEWQLERRNIKSRKRRIRGQCHRADLSIIISASCVQRRTHQYEYSYMPQRSYLNYYLRSMKYDRLEDTAAPASAAPLADLCPSVELDVLVLVWLLNPSCPRRYP